MPKSKPYLKEKTKTDQRIKQAKNEGKKSLVLKGVTAFRESTNYWACEVNKQANSKQQDAFVKGQ